LDIYFTLFLAFIAELEKAAPVLWLLAFYWYKQNKTKQQIGMFFDLSFFNRSLEW
jgi:hypothetical protein